jgi:hypothetical protein
MCILFLMTFTHQMIVWNQHKIIFDPLNQSVVQIQPRLYLMRCKQQHWTKVCGQQLPTFLDQTDKA